jgi:hypothetical protein
MTKRAKHLGQQGVALITAVFLLAISVVAIGATISLTYTDLSTVVFPKARSTVWAAPPLQLSGPSGPLSPPPSDITHPRSGTGPSRLTDG